MSARLARTDDADGVVFFPVRHHSPTCAHALGRALSELRPAQVLVEAPVDFESLIPALVDPLTIPPVAIVSLAEAGAAKATVSTYPFCVHSPELIALTWASRAGARSRLIDLPARHEDMRRRFIADAPGPLIETFRLDHNAYVTELCARRGLADGAALWDALFESQGPLVDWRGYFGAVGVYCAHIRAVTPADEIEGDGTLAREAHMAACLAVAREGPGPIAVITGGFHTPALRASLAAPHKASPLNASGVKAPGVKAPSGASYLIRYGFQQLDRASGYGAGLPHPRWYDRLWRALDGERDLDNLALDALLDFGEHLRRTAPGLALSTPVLTQTGLAASRLAALRDLPFAGRSEIFDAVRSAAVKDAIEVGRTPLLQAFSEFMTGDAIGSLPPGAIQPPLVDAVRAQAKALGFRLEGGERRIRELDILRKARHADASHFLFALDLADAQFAHRISGPDPISGWREDALIETWSYAWSPLVESRLISRSEDGASLEAVCRAELFRRRAALEELGQARSTAAVAGLWLAAVRTGLEDLSVRVLDWCVETLAEDPEAGSIIRALALTAAVAAGDRGGLGAACRQFRGKGFERLLLLFPNLAQTPPERLNELARSLADLAALAGEDDGAIDQEALAGALTEALAGRLPPALEGALAAFAGLLGVWTEDAVADRVGQGLDGAYVDASDKAAVLSGCLTVSPRLLVNSAPMLAATDRFLAGLDTADFLAVLPGLRLALSQLSPSEIDRVAAWVAGAHGLTPDSFAETAMPAAEVAANLILSDQLQDVWARDGLAEWMVPAS